MGAVLNYVPFKHAALSCFHCKLVAHVLTVHSKDGMKGRLGDVHLGLLYFERLLSVFWCSKWTNQMSLFYLFIAITLANPSALDPGLATLLKRSVQPGGPTVSK